MRDVRAFFGVRHVVRIDDSKFVALHAARIFLQIGAEMLHLTLHLQGVMQQRLARRGLTLAAALCAVAAAASKRLRDARNCAT